MIIIIREEEEEEEEVTAVTNEGIELHMIFSHYNCSPCTLHVHLIVTQHEKS
jgi:hypothetical protein